MNDKPEKIGDLWRTPPEPFNCLDLEFNFYADMAASYDNAKCQVFFNEADNSLGFDWADRLNAQYPTDLNKYVWLNCPYSNPMPWVKQAVKAQSKGLGVVMLLNADTSVGWFSEALKGASEIRFIIGDKKAKGAGYNSGRLAFLNHNGDPVPGNNKPQFILVFNPFKIGANVTSYVKRSDLYK